MSITKRSKQQMGAFRSAVSHTENERSEKIVEEQQNPKELREKLIEDLAHDLIQKPAVRKNPLDKVSRNINIAVSPRTEARWRFISGQEGRNMSDFVRRGVEFYIRTHGLE